jgi:hypothetical protein
MAAAPAAYNPFQPVLDMTREFVLTYPTPTIQIADRHTVSTTLSAFRLHWNTLEEWRGFADLVTAYWNNNVTPNDKQSLVYNGGEYGGRYRRLSSGISRAANEGDVSSLHNEFVTPVLGNAANGIDNAPLPSDRHSRLQRWSQGVEARALAGIPDSVMVTDFGHPGYPRRITAMVEIKNPWRVTPDLVDQVIQSILPLILLRLIC